MTANNIIIYFNHASSLNNQAQLETIVQLNINSYFSYFKKLPDVHRIIADFQPLAFCLQETNLKNNTTIPTLKYYKGYFKNRNQGRATNNVKTDCALRYKL